MLLFIFNAVLLGVGLAMDAFSVSIANGLSEPDMSPGKGALMAATYAFFQWFMPMAGWVCVHTIVETFTALQAAVPYVALALLLFVGGRMIVECLRGGEDARQAGRLTPGRLLVQIGRAHV